MSATGGAKPKSWWERFASLRPRAKQARPESELLFPSEFIASLERLRLAALKALGGGLHEGHRLGAYKGGQLEFHGHRNYVPGDELRHVDWNSYARLGRPYVKEFAREEAGVLHLLLDATPSMALGQPAKWNFARRVAALFAHVALSSQDTVHIHVFRREDGAARFPANGKSGGIRGYLSFLAQSELDKPVPEQLSTERKAGAAPRVLEKAVTRFLRGNPARGRALLLGDFWHEENEIVASVARLSGAGFDVSAIHVLAAEELQPECAGELLVRDAEDGERVTLFGGTDFTMRYTAELEAHRQKIEAALRRRGGLYLLARSDTSIERVLIATLRQRRWVM